MISFERTIIVFKKLLFGTLKNINDVNELHIQISDKKLRAAKRFTQNSKLKV